MKIGKQQTSSRLCSAPQMLVRLTLFRSFGIIKQFDSQYVFFRPLLCRRKKKLLIKGLVLKEFKTVRGHGLGQKLAEVQMANRGLVSTDGHCLVCYVCEDFLGMRNHTKTSYSNKKLGILIQKNDFIAK